ncbi:Uncharacterised protein [Shimwellia blattae]|nr:Uncharacterised protein [Shimwellia blattae]VEC22265.1 Uncharacterised protein [Shimwellia blattae]
MNNRHTRPEASVYLPQGGQHRQAEHMDKTAGGKLIV